MTTDLKDLANRVSLLRIHIKDHRDEEIETIDEAVKVLRDLAADRRRKELTREEPAGPVAEEVEAVAARLDERTALRYMGDCKCGHCALVDVGDVKAAASLLRRLSVDRDEAKSDASFMKAAHGEVADLLKKAEAERDEAIRQRDQAIEALNEAEETLRLVEHPSFEDPVYGSEVRALGARIGFGALMSSASASWRKALEPKDLAGAEFVSGPCHTTVVRTIAKIRSTLAAIRQTQGGEHDH